MPWEPKNTDCQQARYSLNADGTVAVLNSQYTPSTDKVDSAPAVATFDGAQGSVKFFPYAPAGDYEVLSTDYENYAIVYSCSSLYLAKAEYLWVLTRNQEVNDSVVFEALNIIKAKLPKYDQTLIRRTKQGTWGGVTCKYLSNEFEISQWNASVV